MYLTATVFQSRNATRTHTLCHASALRKWLQSTAKSQGVSPAVLGSQLEQGRDVHFTLGVQGRSRGDRGAVSGWSIRFKVVSGRLSSLLQNPCTDYPRTSCSLKPSHWQRSGVV